MSKNKQNEFIEPVKTPFRSWWQGVSGDFSYWNLPTISESKQKKEKLEGIPAIFYRSYRECPETGRLSLSVLFLNHLVNSGTWCYKLGCSIYSDTKLSKAIQEGTDYFIKDPTLSFNRYNNYRTTEKNSSETRIEALAKAVECSNKAETRDRYAYYFKSKMARFEGTTLGKMRSPYYSLYLRKLLKSGVFQVKKPGIENVVRFLNSNIKSNKYKDRVKKLSTMFYDIMGKSSGFINTHEIELLTSTPGTLIAYKPLSPL